MELIDFYNRIESGEYENVFIGDEKIACYLGYVLDVPFLCCNNIVNYDERQKLYVVDDVMNNTSQYCVDEQDNVMGLSSFLSVLDTVNKTRYNLKEMFIKTICDHPLQHVDCRAPFDHVYVNVGGDLSHCCLAWLPYIVGNVCDSNKEPADSVLSRIIRVSFMNHTYSFCNTNLCPFMHDERENLYCDENTVGLIDKESFRQSIELVDIAFDFTCNLRCKSCRKEVIIEQNEELINISNKIKEKLMPTTKIMLIAGNGEVFLSKAYRNILLSDNYPEDMTLRLLSNGMLFNENAWKLVENRFHRIELYISIDAAEKETYEYLRVNGKWEILMKNLEFASNLRKEEKIKFFRINFVVQKRNYREMPKFVALGNRLNCDQIAFGRIEYWPNSGISSEEFYESISVYDKNGNILPELKEVLKDPIFKGPRVALGNVV